MNPELIYAIDPVALSRVASALPREAIHVAMLFDGHRRLWEVVRDSYLSGRMTMSVVGRLASIGVVNEATQVAKVATEVVYPPRPVPVRAVTPWPMPKAVRIPSEVENVEIEAATEAPRRDDVITQRLPKPLAPEPQPLADPSAATVRVDAAQLAAARIQAAPAVVRITPVMPVSEGPVDAPAVEPKVEPEAVMEANACKPVPAFDDTDEQFFGSYVPEDGAVDTFWDLEDSPARQLRARRRAKRLQQGSWFRQILSIW